MAKSFWINEYNLRTKMHVQLANYEQVMQSKEIDNRVLSEWNLTQVKTKNSSINTTFLMQTCEMYKMFRSKLCFLTSFILNFS